jgi:leader peptidase (prepilin peptidase)/N-methyltransferase
MTAIDLQYQMIPDAITLPGIPIGLLMNLATGRMSWIESSLGILVGGGLFFVIIVASRGGMGGGDLKLGAMLGAFLGWKALVFGLFIAIVLGGAIGAVLLLTGRRGRKDPIPFGPFLAAGGAMALFWGEQAFSWWMGGFGG